MEEKLYSPLNFYLRETERALEGGYDENQYWRDELTHEEAFGYMDEIEGFLQKDRRTYDVERGLMEYRPDSPVNDKVRSLVPHVELHGDRLWMVAHLQMTEPLTPLEMANLKSWWGGQLSDGWGEGIEQREIMVDRGELYMEPWTSANSFFVATQEEFDRRMGIERPAAAHIDEVIPGRDALLANIAKKHCHFETLEVRKSDSLDFREVSVWGMQAALEAAFEAGRVHKKSMALATTTELAPSASAQDMPTGRGHRSLLKDLEKAQARTAKNDSQKNHHDCPATPEPER